MSKADTDKSAPDRTETGADENETGKTPDGGKSEARATDSTGAARVNPPGDGIPRSPSTTVAVPRRDRAAGKVNSGEPDHSGIREKRERQEAEAKDAKAARAEKRKAMRAGTLSGHFVPFGDSLVNMSAITKLDLPREGDENPTMTVSLFGGGTASVTGDEATELMEELGLKALPKTPDPSNMVHREDGRILSAEDHKVDSENPGRVASVPNHPHRANAVLTDAETDRDVLNRAGNVAIPPTRDISIPPGEAANDTAADGSEGSEAAGDKPDAGETEVPAATSRDASSREATPKTVRGAGRTTARGRK